MAAKRKTQCCDTWADDSESLHGSFTPHRRRFVRRTAPSRLTTRTRRGEGGCSLHCPRPRVHWLYVAVCVGLVHQWHPQLPDYTCPVRSNSTAQRREGPARQRMRPHNRPARVVDEGPTLLTKVLRFNTCTSPSPAARRGLCLGHPCTRISQVCCCAGAYPQTVRCASVALLTLSTSAAAAGEGPAASRRRLVPAPVPPGPTPPSSSASLLVGRWVSSTHWSLA